MQIFKGATKFLASINTFYHPNKGCYQLAAPISQVVGADTIEKKIKR
jgi:hypothetical protein